MTDFLFGWITKPKIQMSFLDDCVKTFEFIFLFVVVFIVWAVIDVEMRKRKIKRSREKHGKDCTCWNCMGVNV